MPRISLRRLRTHTSEVMKDVKTNRTQYVITDRGEPVAVITPYAPTEEAVVGVGSRYLDELQQLSAKIGNAWKEPLSAAELVRDMRR